MRRLTGVSCATEPQVWWLCAAFFGALLFVRIHVYSHLWSVSNTYLWSSIYCYIFIVSLTLRAGARGGSSGPPGARRPVRSGSAHRRPLKWKPVFPPLVVFINSYHLRSAARRRKRKEKSTLSLPNVGPPARPPPPRRPPSGLQRPPRRGQVAAPLARPVCRAAPQAGGSRGVAAGQCGSRRWRDDRPGGLVQDGDGVPRTGPPLYVQPVVGGLQRVAIRCAHPPPTARRLAVCPIEKKNPTTR